MRKLLLFATAILLMNSCSTLSGNQKSSWTDFSFMEGQAVVGQVLQKKLPFEITVNVEVRNPGTSMAAVNSIQWIAFIDALQLAQGTVSQRVEVQPSGGLNKIPIRVQADLFDYLEGDKPRALLNFALNLLNAGDQASQMTLKIKPSVLIGTQEVQYPDYFNITKEFKSGN